MPPQGHGEAHLSIMPQGTHNLVSHTSSKPRSVLRWGPASPSFLCSHPCTQCLPAPYPCETLHTWPWPDWVSPPSHSSEQSTTSINHCAYHAHHPPLDLPSPSSGGIPWSAPSSDTASWTATAGQPGNSNPPQATLKGDTPVTILSLSSCSTHTQIVSAQVHLLLCPQYPKAPMQALMQWPSRPLINQHN